MSNWYLSHLIRPCRHTDLDHRRRPPPKVNAVAAQFAYQLREALEGTRRRPSCRGGAVQPSELTELAADLSFSLTHGLAEAGEVCHSRRGGSPIAAERK